MVDILPRETEIKSKIKKRIKSLKNTSTSGLTNAYLDSLSVKKLRDLYNIVKTMRIEKKF